MRAHSGAQLVPAQGRMCAGEQLSVRRDPPCRRRLHAAFLYLLSMPSLVKPRVWWERDVVVAGRNQLQKQSLYLAQPE